MKNLSIKPLSLTVEIFGKNAVQELYVTFNYFLSFVFCILWFSVFLCGSIFNFVLGLLYCEELHLPVLQ